MNKAEKLINILKEIGDLEDNDFKKNAYYNAMIAVSENAKNLCKWDHSDWIRTKFIGASIGLKIMEFCETGKIKKLIELRKTKKNKPKKKISMKGEFVFSDAMGLINPVILRLSKR